MSETVPLDQLINEKMTVEVESRELDEEQKQLKARAKALTERIIQELKKKNNDKQKAVNQLQSTVNELESQLNALSSSSSGDVSGSDLGNMPLEASTLPANDSVSFTEVAEEIQPEQESKDKKKRKIF